MEIGRNIFLDFGIVLESDPQKLTKELDVLIASHRYIFIWSKKYTVSYMKEYCSKIIIQIDEKEREIHRKCKELREKGKLYEDIAKATGADMSKIGFYIREDPNKIWRLSDWILDYVRKDSSFYQKADYIVDQDERIIERFKRAGIPGKVIKGGII